MHAAADPSRCAISVPPHSTTVVPPVAAATRHGRPHPRACSPQCLPWRQYAVKLPRAGHEPGTDHAVANDAHHGLPGQASQPLTPLRR